MMDTPSRYPIPARRHRAEEVIRRSRFITTLAHAPTAEAAQDFIAQIREEFPDATHHCWAFVAGPPGNTTSIGMSDDGEPHGTAGRPMLTTLLHGAVGEIVAVCTRYFGGTKLGTGGLTRAYSASVKLALETLPMTEKVERIGLLLTADYESVDPIKRVLEELEAVVLSETFGQEVEFRAAVPAENLDELAARVAGITRGRGRIDVSKEAGME
jgi:uncharacterized YigZ family protein